MTTTVNENSMKIINEVERGRFKHALFDFDGTISLLREGWQGIMAPVCIDAIRGDRPATPEIESAVREMIDETTGIQTILQMERLVEMVREFGLVQPDKILDAHGYKAIYNERLLVPVRERLAKLASGELHHEDVTLRGAVDFVRRLHERGLTLYVFSGTDRHDVRNEAEKIGVAAYFNEIWGALRTAEEYSKERVLRDIIKQHDLHGAEVLVVGDGPVEIRNAKQFGCVALGVASDEVAGHGWDAHKEQRLAKAGADILIPDFGNADALEAYLFPA